MRVWSALPSDLFPSSILVSLESCLCFFGVVMLGTGHQLKLEQFTTEKKMSAYKPDGAMSAGMQILDVSLVKKEFSINVKLLPVHLCPYPQLWSRVLGSDRMKPWQG